MKALDAIRVTDDGIEICDNLEQPENTLLFKATSEDDNVTWFSEEQPEKAELPTSVTEFGRTISVNILQSLNA